MSNFNPNKANVTNQNGEWDFQYLQLVQWKQKNDPAKNIFIAQSAAGVAIFPDPTNFAVQNPLDFNPFLISHFTKWDKKECFYATGIKNMIKKNEFLQLTLQRAKNQITIEEFKSEITSNPDKYTINIAPLKDRNDLFVLSEIVNNLNSNLSIDDASEMFSIDYEDLKNNLNEIANN